MVVAIVGGQLYYNRGGINYFSPLNFKYLSQWTPLFDRVRLLVTRVESAKMSSDWVPIPTEYDVREISIFDLGPYARRRVILERAKEHLKGVSLLYARGPNYESYYTFCFARKRGIPLLYEMHGDWETSVLSEQSNNLIRVITRRLRAGLVRNLQARMGREAIAVISIGPALAEKYVPSGKPVLISTNHHIDENQFVCRQDYVLNKQPKILFVGVLNYYKGLKFLFGALRLLKKEGRSFEMILVGSGLQESSLKNYARQHGLLDSIKFVGKISFSEVMSYYRKADLFVLPSVGGEGVPRVIQEAFSCGCPVLATDVGSVAWQLEGGAGIVVPPRSETALAENIKRLFDDESFRRSIGEAGYARGLEFTFEKQACRIADFVKKYVPKNLPKVEI